MCSLVQVWWECSFRYVIACSHGYDNTIVCNPRFRWALHCWCQDYIWVSWWSCFLLKVNIIVFKLSLSLAISGREVNGYWSDKWFKCFKWFMAMKWFGDYIGGSQAVVGICVEQLGVSGEYRPLKEKIFVWKYEVNGSIAKNMGGGIIPVPLYFCLWCLWGNILIYFFCIIFKPHTFCQVILISWLYILLGCFLPCACRLLFRSIEILWNLVENGNKEEVSRQLNSLVCIK